MTIEVRLKNYQTIIDRLNDVKKDVSPDNQRIKTALTRAALIITNQAKLNLKKHGLIDTGRLINSLRFEFYKPVDGGTGVRIGSFGVPYAYVWEGLSVPKPPLYPFWINLRIKAHQRTITQAFGKPIAPTTVTVRPHQRNVVAKPYLRPAYEQHKMRITETIRRGMSSGL